MGAFNPSPTRTGDERAHVEEALLESLLEADGTALAHDPGTAAYAERFAESRCLAYLWHLLDRLGNQADPDRMTDMLPRWERILGLSPFATDTPTTRRAKVKAKLQAAGAPPTEQVVTDLLAAVLGPVFQELRSTASSAAVGAVPSGVMVPGGVTLPDGEWSSTIAHVLVRVTQPANMDDPTFYRTVGQLGAYLDDLLPAWVTWSWGRFSSANAPGFILDDPHNLDNEYFS